MMTSETQTIQTRPRKQGEDTFRPGCHHQDAGATRADVLGLCVHPRPSPRGVSRHPEKCYAPKGSNQKKNTAGQPTLCVTIAGKDPTSNTRDVCVFEIGGGSLPAHKTNEQYIQ